jgi:hypothetical protein
MTQEDTQQQQESSKKKPAKTKNSPSIMARIGYGALGVGSAALACWSVTATIGWVKYWREHLPNHKRIHLADFIAKNSPIDRNKTVGELADTFDRGYQSPCISEFFLQLSAGMLAHTIGMIALAKISYECFKRAFPSLTKAAKQTDTKEKETPEKSNEAKIEHAG